MYVNLSTGIYGIIEQDLVPLNSDVKFDYVVDITYRPHSKLEDAPNFKNYVETSVGMDQYECLMRTLGYAIGHCNSGTTLNVYSHMFQNAQAKVSEAMDKAFAFLPQKEDTE